jgi:hypothetical protein
MSKRNRKPAAATTGGRARSVPITIDKPKPWGTIAVALLLAAALIGILVYAVLNTGSGVRDLLAEEDESFRGITVSNDLARDHVAGPVEYPDYPARPPMGGQHNAVPQQCDVYTEPIPAEHAVHSLEHGATWVTYSPDLPAEQVEELTELIEGNPYRMLSPLPGQEAPIVATAWGRQITAQTAGDEELQRFLQTYTDGRQTPEKGAACVGNTGTGATPVGAAPEGAVPSPLPTQ